MRPPLTEVQERSGRLAEVLRMKKVTFLQIAERVLREEQEALSPVEIWEVASTKGYSDLLVTRGSTPWQTISARINGSIKNDRMSPFLKLRVKGRRKFSLKELQKTSKSRK
jgi:uncharacterized protein